ncbi:putative spermidine/putrescine transport system ATP-binding protein [Thermomonospora echinospora]|uniref:ABC-type quaternary amine transporter n=1 Tax=Thermomonospora echinospora TaxID=1992 RepID=A0A1H5SNB6_9ACTN|nr:ABC transporter ATP-binding protein [Thermomonospora echinospora]SEF51944.1 putative spermidine/putrescine transport system ATP-binding protein [Thermomonospora echinospora]
MPASRGLAQTPDTERAGRAGRGAEIALDRLTKRYGDFVAVDEVSLTIEPGEFMTLLGPSGSGKTTTLNAIAGFVTPTSGSLRMDGTAIESAPPHKRDIGMVFQHYALFPHMTVAENIAYPLRRRKIAKDRRRELVAAALETVRLGEYGHRYPRELSGGQQQRVAVARAIVYGPRVLLMDEPLGALDKKLRDWLQLEIKRIHAELGTTFVYVTHDQDEALVLSDRIAVFNNGRIEQVGSAHALYERPETLFVAKFLGESTVLRGAAEAGAGRSALGKAGRTLTAAGELTGAAAIVIRPERLVVVGAGERAEPGWNALPATVLQEIYLGSSRKLELRLPDGDTALVREAAGRLSAARPGDEVTLTWRVEDAVLLPDDPDVETVLT